MWVWSIIVGVVSQKWVWLVKDTTILTEIPMKMLIKECHESHIIMDFIISKFLVSHEWTFHGV